MIVDSPMSGPVAPGLSTDLASAIFRSERLAGVGLTTFHRTPHITPHVGGLIPLIKPLGIRE